jgi:hypothetical protein
VKKRFTLLIGALGSDTTALFRHLGAHPQVLPCRVAEPRFFSDDRKWALGVEFYRSLWDFREPDERIALEASTDYARHPQVRCPAERIAQMPTGFRFVYLLCDPLARIEAHHAQALEEGRLRRPLAEEVPTELVDASRYAAQLEAYRRWFPPEDFLLVAQERLERAPVAELQRICSFLEIDPYFGFPELSAEADAAAPPARRPGLLERLRAQLADPPAGRASRTPPSLSAEQRARLAEELHDDSESLRREWGFDVSVWDPELRGAA